MQKKETQRMTEAEYLKMERASETKHEYVQGEIFAMTGASRRHNLIFTNLFGELRNKLRNGPCLLFPSDMRVKINPSRDYVYPDITIVCEKEEYSDDEEDAITNPNIIIEILSKSTEAYDRGLKFTYYRKLTSLNEYVLVSQEMKQIEKHKRNATGLWQFEVADEEHPEMILETVGCRPHIDDVYENIFD